MANRHYIDGCGFVRLGSPRVGGQPPRAVAFESLDRLSRLEAVSNQWMLVARIESECPSGFADLCGAMTGR